MLKKDGVPPTPTSNSPAGNASSDANPAGNVNADANQSGATSSNPGDAKTDNQKPKDPVDLVSDVLKATGDSSSSEGSSDGQKPEAAKTGDTESDENTDSEAGGDDDGIPQEFHNHPRWQKLKTERNEARQQLAQLQREVVQIQADAQDYQSISSFMESNDISAEEVAETLEWIALRNSDPEAFYQKFSEMKDAIDSQFGAVLPKDLQDQVDSGEITEEHAKRIVRAEARANLNRTHADRVSQRTQRQNQQTQLEQFRGVLRDSVNGWEQQQMQKDPDYKVKKPFVADRMRALFAQHGMPRTQAEAIAYAEKAYKDVSAHMAKALPAKKPVTPSPQPGKNVQVVAQPKTAQDIVSNILAAGA